jgi:hypothetical protein
MPKWRTRLSPSGWRSWYHWDDALRVIDEQQDIRQDLEEGDDAF